MDEPPALEDGSSFGRPRHKTGISEDDPHNLEERYYRYGIKPEWIQIHRIVTHELVSLSCLLFTFSFINAYATNSVSIQTDIATTISDEWLE